MTSKFGSAAWGGGSKSPPLWKLPLRHSKPTKFCVGIAWWYLSSIKYFWLLQQHRTLVAAALQQQYINIVKIHNWWFSMFWGCSYNDMKSYQKCSCITYCSHWCCSCCCCNCFCCNYCCSCIEFLHEFSLLFSIFVRNVKKNYYRNKNRFCCSNWWCSSSCCSSICCCSSKSCWS